MIKEWYYVENGEKKGPVTCDELKVKISKEKLLWKEGMADWTMAGHIETLKDIFELTPPQFPILNH